jgi:hypothetical protein
VRPGSLRIRALFVGFALVAPALAACDSWFERDAPAVDRAIVELDAGDAHAAASLLADYLESGQCTDGFDPKPAIEGKPAAGFDFGLALFRIGEGYGKRFGDVGSPGEPPDDEEVKQHRAREIACAKKLVRTVEESDVATAALKLRAHYLDGNLSFLAGDYTEAVHAYDRALTLAPAVADGGDAISRDAAFNRAIALRRQNDPKDGGADGAPPDGGGDGGSDGGNDAGNDGGGDAGNDGGDGGGDGGDAGNDGGGDGGNKGDGGGDGGNKGDGGGGDGGEGQNDAGSTAPPPQPPPSPSAATPMDERTLDELERAPIFQREVGRAMRQRTRDMEDK